MGKRKKTAKMGRPHKPWRDVRLHIVTLRLTDDERRRYEGAARKAGVSFSDWVRVALEAFLKR